MALLALNYIVSFFEEIGWKFILDRGEWMGFFDQAEQAVILVNTDECETSKTTLHEGVHTTIMEDFSDLTKEQKAIRLYAHQQFAELCFNFAARNEKGYC